MGLAAVFAVATFVPVAFGQQRAAGPEGAQPVIVATARLAEIVDRVEALGTTRANESVEIAAKVTAKVVEIRFEDGSSVAAGDILVVLDTFEEEADLAAAEAVATERRLAYERALQLERRQFTATAQLDERRAALRQAEAEVQAIRARIADRVIRAPFAGVVGLRNLSVGALVKPGDMITTLDDLGVIKVDITVPDVYLATLRPGLPIVGTVPAFGARRFEGEIKSVDTRVDPVTRSIVVRAEVPNADGGLRPGLLMTIELLKSPRQAVVVPEEALVPRGRGNTVFVVAESNGHTVEARAVEIGARRPGEVEIVSGLAAGETVVTHGSLHLTPGQRVTVVAGEPVAGPAGAGPAPGSGG